MTYRLPSLQVYYSLKILTLAGYIDYEEDPNNKSRVFFIVQRDELYRLHQLTQNNERIIQALLRKYSGLFADYVYIDEEFLSQQLHLSPKEVYDALLSLDKQKIIDYVPQRNTPMIIYTRQREEANSITIPRSIYEEKQIHYREKIEAVKAYLNNHSLCRSIQLVSYFGESAQQDDCGICDVCINNQKREADLTAEQFHSIEHGVYTVLKQKPLSSLEIIEALPYSKKEIINVLSQLSDNGLILLSDDIYSMVNKK